MMAKASNGAVAERESGVVRAEHKAPKLVGIEVTDQQVLQFNMMDDVELIWEGDAFRKLSDEVQNQLKPENLKRYLRADLAAEERAEAFLRKTKVRNPFNPLQGEAETREFIRARPGWHQCWKNPGREYDTAMLGPYKPVRMKSKEQEASGCVSGDEKGEVLKRMDAENKVEAIACECPQELFEEYLSWMDAESTRRYQGLTEDFRGSIEEINRKTSRSDARIIPIIDGKELKD